MSDLPRVTFKTYTFLSPDSNGLMHLICKEGSSDYTPRPFIEGSPGLYHALCGKFSYLDKWEDRPIDEVLGQVTCVDCLDTYRRRQVWWVRDERTT